VDAELTAAAAQQLAGVIQAHGSSGMHAVLSAAPQGTPISRIKVVAALMVTRSLWFADAGGSSGEGSQQQQQQQVPALSQPAAGTGTEPEWVLGSAGQQLRTQYYHQQQQPSQQWERCADPQQLARHSQQWQPSQQQQWGNMQPAGSQTVQLQPHGEGGQQQAGGWLGQEECPVLDLPQVHGQPGLVAVGPCTTPAAQAAAAAGAGGMAAAGWVQAPGSSTIRTPASLVRGAAAAAAAPVAVGDGAVTPGSLVGWRQRRSSSSAAGTIMKQPPEQQQQQQQQPSSGQYSMCSQHQQQQQPWCGTQVYNNNSSSTPQHSAGQQLGQGPPAGAQEQPEWVYKKSSVQQQLMGPPAQVMLAGAGQVYQAPGNPSAAVPPVLATPVGHQQVQAVGEQLKASVGASTVVRKRSAPLSLLGGAKSSRLK
jgi:hypothetical protein